MAEVARLILQVLPAADSDAEELADLAGELHAELLGVDEASVVLAPGAGAASRQDADAVQKISVRLAIQMW